MSIIVGGTIIPTNGDYIKVGSTLVDKVDVVQNNVRTTVWQKQIHQEPEITDKELDVNNLGWRWVSSGTSSSTQWTGGTAGMGPVGFEDIYAHAPGSGYGISISVNDHGEINPGIASEALSCSGYSKIELSFESTSNTSGSVNNYIPLIKLGTSSTTVLSNSDTRNTNYYLEGVGTSGDMPGRQKTYTISTAGKTYFSVGMTIHCSPTVSGKTGHICLYKLKLIK